MKKIISNIFSGVLNLQGSENGYDSFFNVQENIITVIPMTEECRRAIETLSDNDDSSRHDQWLYGIAEDNCCVSILKRTHLRVGFSSGIDLGTAKFATPIIVKNTVAQYVDLSTFDSIEFYGGIIDILHPPGLKIEEKYCEKRLVFNEMDVFTKKYEVEVNKEIFEVVYSISASDLCSEAGQVPDLRNSIHSVLRFNFKTSQKLCDIEKYYSYAMNLFQFCIGMLNVRSEVKLYKKGQSQPILLRFCDDFHDYANDTSNFTQVIRFQMLGDLFPKLFKLLNEEETQPYLLFLPQQNKYTNSIIYTNVNDLCVAFEREYNLLKLDSKSEEDVEAAKDLTAYLLEEIDKRSDCPVAVKTKAKNILNSQLKAFSPSLKEKIFSIYNEFVESAKPITEQKDHDRCRISTFYSIDQFKEKIGQFVAIRNRASHAGIVWNDGTKIFWHLKLCIYFCILKRADYSSTDSARILSWLFSRKF